MTEWIGVNKQRPADDQMVLAYTKKPHEGSRYCVMRFDEGCAPAGPCKNDAEKYPEGCALVLTDPERTCSFCDDAFSTGEGAWDPSDVIAWMPLPDVPGSKKTPKKLICTTNKDITGAWRWHWKEWTQLAHEACYMNRAFGGPVDGFLSEAAAVADEDMLRFDILRGRGDIVVEQDTDDRWQWYFVIMGLKRASGPIYGYPAEDKALEAANHMRNLILEVGR